MKRRHLIIGGGLAVAAPTFMAGRARAQSASALGSTLTPTGADPKASVDGLVSAWTGGVTTPPPGWNMGDPPPNLYPDDKPIFTVTQDNMAQYDAMLCEGQRQMLKQYGASGFKMHVYPSRRSFAAPQYVYDNTALNVTRARPSSAGWLWGFEGAVGGIPFPIPSSDPTIAGMQIMWNHQAKFQGQYTTFNTGVFVCGPNGAILTTAEHGQYAYPYYFKDVKPETYSGLIFQSLVDYIAPANQVGGKANFSYSSDLTKVKNTGFEYLVGEGRIREAPQAQYDVPESEAGDAINYDESELWNGAMDRYDWKLVDKKQMIVMYNCHDFVNATPNASTLGPEFVNPELIRWEIHRCHVVEATLAPGKRHTMPHRRFYVDEDMWVALLADGWDAQGNYWHFGGLLPSFFFDRDGPLPFVPSQITYNLQSNQYVTEGSWFGAPPPIGGLGILTTPIPEVTFDPQSMVASGSL